MCSGLFKIGQTFCGTRKCLTKTRKCSGISGQDIAVLVVWMDDMDCKVTRLLFWAIVLSSSCCTCSGGQGLPTVRSASSRDTQRRAVEDMLERLVPGRRDEFSVRISDVSHSSSKDFYELGSLRDGRLRVVASSGVAAAAGIYRYLRTRCATQYTWSVRTMRVPTPLPRLEKVVRTTRPDRCDESFG